MHAISFMTKRAHWAAVRMSKKVLAKFPRMTPARFDLMYLLRRAWVENRFMNPLGPSRFQASVWKELGLHRTTVSRMVRQLVQMGWIWRARASMDGRTFDLALTRRGLSILWRVMRVVFRQKILRKAYEAPFKPDPFRWPPSKGPERRALDVLFGHYRMLTRFARLFGDRSCLLYELGGALPWRPLILERE